MYIIIQCYIINQSKVTSVIHTLIWYGFSLSKYDKFRSSTTSRISEVISTASGIILPTFSQENLTLELKSRGGDKLWCFKNFWSEKPLTHVANGAPADVCFSVLPLQAAGQYCP